MNPSMLTPHSRTPVLVSALTLCLMGLVVFGLDHGVWRARHTMGFLVSFPASILWALARTQSPPIRAAQLARWAPQLKASHSPLDRRRTNTASS